VVRQTLGERCWERGEGRRAFASGFMGGPLGRKGPGTIDVADLRLDSWREPYPGPCGDLGTTFGAGQKSETIKKGHQNRVELVGRMHENIKKKKR